MPNYEVYPRYPSDYPKGYSATSYPSTFTAYNNSNGEIVKTNRDGDKIVGVDLQRYDDLLARAEKAEAQREEFYQKLVEHGIIEEPKTAEQVSQEQIEKLTALVETQTKQNAKLLSRLEKIEKGGKQQNGRNVNTKKTTSKPKTKSTNTKSAGNVGRNTKQTTIKPILEE